MNYFKQANQFPAQEPIAKTVRDLIKYQYLVRPSTYSNPMPQGDLSGPTTISDISQEVSSSSNPTYAPYLHGFYHLNK